MKRNNVAPPYFGDPHLVVLIIEKAVKEALAQRRALGLPIVVSRNGAAVFERSDDTSSPAENPPKL